MFRQNFFATLLLTFVLLQISHVLAEFPAQILGSQHQVSIRLLANDVPYGAGHICSGVLISNYTVLTTASCLLKDKDSGTFYGREELTVAMGNLNRFTQNEAYTFNSEVTAIKTHGRFNKRTYANNLAILEVNSVKFGLTVIPVLTSSEKVSTTLDCHVLGWKTNYGQLTDDLMQSDVTTMSCNSDDSFPPSTFCTGKNGDLDSCVGEDGAGLICGDYSLRGVVTTDCTQNERGLTVFTDVSQLYNWIIMYHIPADQKALLKIIDNEFLRHILFSFLDFVAYYLDNPKFPDDYEILKYLF